MSEGLELAASYSRVDCSRHKPVLLLLLPLMIIIIVFIEELLY